MTDVVTDERGNANPQCQGQTKAKTQCKKAARAGEDYCAQHTPVEVEVDPEVVKAEFEAYATRIDPATGKPPTPEREAWLVRRELAPVGQHEVIPRGQGLQLHSPKGAARRARKIANQARQGLGAHR